MLSPTAALYGPNAHNGLVNIITKDPRNSEGTTAVIGGGNQSVISARARHAQVINDQFAFKLAAGYTQGEEFAYVDSVYLGATSTRSRAKCRPTTRQRRGTTSSSPTAARTTVTSRSRTPSAGYRVTQQFTIMGQVVNVFDSDAREFVASPAIGRLYTLQLRVNL